MSERLPVTPGQTIGPFYHYALLNREKFNEVVAPHHPDVIELTGRVVDGLGKPLPDCMLEIWQVGPDGKVPTERDSLKRKTGHFTGWGRTSTNTDGEYRFFTLTPGSANGENPFFAVALFARGILHVLRTRIYLPLSDDAAAKDPFLSMLPAERRQTLIAKKDEYGYRFDINLQGDDETVFIEFN